MNTTRSIYAALTLCAVLSACTNRSDTTPTPNAVTQSKVEESVIAVDSASATAYMAPDNNTGQDFLPPDTNAIPVEPKSGGPVADRSPAGDGSGKSIVPNIEAEKAVVDAQIVRTGSIGIQVESIDTAERILRVVVARNGGYVSNSLREASTGTARSSSTTIRVPAKNFDAAVDAVKSIGSVKAEHITASEVTEEFVDANARLKALEDIDASLLALLKGRSKKLDEVVEIQNKRERVRAEIEHITGRLRVLGNQTAMSTLTVNFNEPGALIPNQPYTSSGRLSTAVDSGVDRAMMMVQGLLSLLITFSPLIVIGVIVWLVMRPGIRRRKLERLAKAAEKRAPVPTT